MIIEKKFPLQINFLKAINSKNFENDNLQIKLHELLQISILLITNYLVTYKIENRKTKKVIFNNKF